MSPAEKLQTLRRVRQLAGGTDDELRLMTLYVDEATVPAGTILAEEGVACHELVIVTSGELEACRFGQARTLGPGDAFGWDAMRDRGANEATLRSVSATRLLVMSHRQFQAAAAIAQPAARECIMPAPPAMERRKETATHIL